MSIGTKRACGWLCQGREWTADRRVEAGDRFDPEWKRHTRGSGSHRGRAARDRVLDLEENGCRATAAGCTNVYVVSIAGVRPAAFHNWFQALAAARNSFKRLPTNAEWQAAAFGTPDPEPRAGDNGSTTCNIHAAGDQSLTGSRSNCVSDVGAFDMVGNVWEWVADAIPRSIDRTPDSCDQPHFEVASGVRRGCTVPRRCRDRG